MFTKNLFCFEQMLLDPMGGIVMTNDGNAILREVLKHFQQTDKLSKLFALVLLG